MTVSCGINIDRLFMLAFAIGSALAAWAAASPFTLWGSTPPFR